MSDNDQARGFVRFLYTQNPFYLISAGLTLYALYVVFGNGEGSDGNPWPLAAALGGYTLLMAFTAFLIVRFGKVWDDARSILIIVLLLFLGLSVSFDEVCNTSPGTAKLVLLGGLAFSLAICEALLRGLGIRLAAGYRGPFYFLLALFFGAPLLCSPMVTGLPRETILWRIFLFPVMAGVAFLTLLPAIRRERTAARDNGTPWRWPWFPGTIFAMLALGVAARAYSLCVSFDEQIGLDSVFGLYFLLPLLLALALVLLEVSRAGGYAQLGHATLVAAPLVLLLPATHSGSFAAEQYLAEVTNTIGSPLWYGLAALAGFYGYAWRGDSRPAEAGFTLAMAGLCFVSPQTRGWHEAALCEWWPLGVVTAVQTVMALRRQTSHRSLVAFWLAILTAAVGMRHADIFSWQGAILCHLALASLLLVGFAFDDAFAHVARRVGAACVALAGLALVTQLQRAAAPFQLLAVYYLCLAMLAVLCGRSPPDRWFRVAGLANLAAGWVALLAAIGQASHGRIPPQAVYCLLFGVVCFGVALAISLAKCGWLKRLAHYLAVWLVLVPAEPQPPA